MAFCSNCGTPAVENARFCSVCGCPVEASKAEPAVEPVVEPVTEPIAEPIAEPVKEPIPEPVPEPIAEPVAEPVTEPVVEVVDEPVSESALFPQSASVDEDEAEDAPSKAKPFLLEDFGSGLMEVTVSTLYYIGMSLLYALPIIGLIASVIMSLKSNRSVSKQNFAKAVLVFKIAGLVLLLAAGIAALVLNKEILEMINDILGENYRSWEQLFNAYEWK